MWKRGGSLSGKSEGAASPVGGTDAAKPPMWAHYCAQQEKGATPGYLEFTSKIECIKVC